MTTRFTSYDPVFDAQLDFRQIMEATARPGKVIQLKDEELQLPEGMNSAAALLGFGLLNADVKFHAENKENWEQFILVNTGSSIAELEEADFVFTSAENAVEAVEKASEGDLQYPETAASIIISTEQVSETPLNHSVFLELDGPGVDGKKEVYIKGLSVDFFETLKEKNSEYPLGVDTYLADTEGNLMVIPRSNNFTIKK